MRKPFHLGPFIVSLHIIDVTGDFKWTEFPEMFLATPNLLRLSIDSAYGGSLDEDLAVLPRVTLALRVFSSRSIPILPSFVDFLETHPNVRDWHHGYERALAEHPDETTPSPVLARFTHYEATIDKPATSAKILLGLTNLAHLSLAESGRARGWEKETFEPVLEALAICGRGLVGLACGTFHLLHHVWTVGHLDWLLRSIITRTPNLHHLCVESWFLPKSFPLDPALRSFIPSSLQTLQLVDTSYNNSDTKNATFEDALRAADIVTNLMPSVVHFSY